MASASTSTPRQIVVDDTDLDVIHYGSSGWFVADPTTLTGGNFGPIFNGTSHATTSNTNLSFAFSGAWSVFQVLSLALNHPLTQAPQ